MSNELEVIRQETGTAVWETLRGSIYPGASNESIIAVINYCKAAGLDPMQKPVHIVPMNGKDVVMPGIGFYRIQAARSGLYAGMSEPEFGKDIEEVFTDRNNRKINVKYPEWCKVTVRKLLNGQIIEFSAKEYWRENCATTGRDSHCPNSMWAKRPYGQLAKCAEAQALRKAFPELLGGLVTSEEMEGKTFDADIGKHASNPKPINNPQTQPGVVNSHQVEEVFGGIAVDTYRIDGKYLDAMELHNLISTKLDNINSLIDITSYETWKYANKAGLAEFAKKNTDMCKHYAEMLASKKEEIDSRFAKEEEIINGEI